MRALGGFTLIEVLVALTLVTIVAAGVSRITTSSNGSTEQAGYQSGATNFLGHIVAEVQQGNPTFIPTTANALALSSGQMRSISGNDTSSGYGNADSYTATVIPAGTTDGLGQFDVSVCWQTNSCITQRTFGVSTGTAPTPVAFSIPALAEVLPACGAVGATVTPVAGTNNVTVTLSTVTSGAVIRYTTDGSAPTSASTYYSGPLTLSTTTTLYTTSMKSGYWNAPIRLIPLVQ